MTVLGFDWSHHQDHTKYNMAALRANGMEFSIAKTSEGAWWRDNTAEEKLKLARAYGMVTGSFHWVTPNETPESQLQNLLNASPDNLLDFYSLDVEDPTYFVPLSYFKDKKLRKKMAKKANKNGYVEILADGTRISETARRLCLLLRRKTTKPILIYTRTSFIRDYAPQMSSWVHQYPVWLAQYRKTPFMHYNPGVAGFLKGWKQMSWQQFKATQVPEINLIYPERPYTPNLKIFQFNADRTCLEGMGGWTEFDLFNGNLSDLYDFIQEVK